MAVEFGGVHALDQSHAVLVGAFELDPELVFKNIGPLGQVIDEEMGGRVLNGLVIDEAALVLVLRQDVGRLESAAPMVPHVHVFHVPVRSQFDTDDEGVPYGQRPLHGLDHRPLLGQPLDEDGFFKFKLE